MSNIFCGHVSNICCAPLLLLLLIKKLTKYNIDFIDDSFSLIMTKDIREALKAISRRKSDIIILSLVN